MRLLRNPKERWAMGAARRACTLARSRDQVFQDGYQAYSMCPDGEVRRLGQAKL